jgi:hypothetical protein
LSGVLALQGEAPRASLKVNLQQSEGPGGSGLKPSGAFAEHIAFQSNFVRLSSYRLRIEEDGERGLWEGRPGIIPATSVKRIPFADPTSRPRLLAAPMAALHLHVLRPLAAVATRRFPSYLLGLFPLSFFADGFQHLEQISYSEPLISFCRRVILSKIWVAVERDSEVVSLVLSNVYGLPRLPR